MDTADLYGWWYIWIPTFIIPLLGTLAMCVASFGLMYGLIKPDKFDSEDKIAFIVVVIGFILVGIGIQWKNQLFMDFNAQGIYFEKMDEYYKMALQPMLIYTIGEILIGLGAFLRTKTSIILKIIALLFVINAVTVNFQWFIAGSHML